MDMTTTLAITIPLVLIFSIPVIVIAIIARNRRKEKARQEFIDHFPFENHLPDRIRKTYPHLTDSGIKFVIQGLRDYFHICNAAGGKTVAMPSQVVDVAWHEFILSTKAYQRFCQNALGQFLHHTPTEAMASPTVAQEGIKRAWRLACRREGIDIRYPAKLPLIFAIDAMLNIEDGFHYTLNCDGKKSDQYCASHIGCSGSTGCSSDTGSSCGGSSCGGGD
ncbi:hypothetical protein VINI7043_17909 [Vibrio nigripulchritudo ATCC 27043]|uniref:glycine-rich domain-containing protein n=1 Tax=Vibrio nigripulchritudo TaxID=28173 RepID=UPI00021C1532|nr:hypothetical protein [Vibrio nigripulchritudo]EGU55720.1 hypothetical protein VINI7043_17909 [Vibrio nigripulchritudo ATCC 27043]